MNKCYATKKTHQYDYLCFREAGGEQLCDSKDSSCDLFCCVFVIVGSDPQNHHLSTDTHSVTGWTHTKHHHPVTCTPKVGESEKSWIVTATLSSKSHLHTLFVSQEWF